MMELKTFVEDDVGVPNPLDNASAARRDYTPPLLLKLGDVRDLTLGGSTGVPESGGAPGTLLP